MLNIEVRCALGIAAKYHVLRKARPERERPNNKIKKAPSFQGANILRHSVFDSFDSFN